MMNSGDYNFSFSGLKTAVLYEARGFCGCRDEALPCLYGNQYQADVAVSFQEAVIDVLVSKTIKAAKQYKVKNIILGGGVSANKELQKRFKNVGAQNFVSLRTPNSNLSTDNALMIAVAAYYNIINNKNIKSWKNIKADANYDTDIA
jgi:N6-L-threonylcarbamoyladenine synthase